MTDTLTASLAVPTYPCTCNGCRQIPTEWFQGMSDHAIYAAVARGGSHYFDEATRRFWESRTLGHRVIHNKGTAVLLVRESLSAGTARIHRVSGWCPFAQHLGNATESTNARKVSAWINDGLAHRWATERAAECACHGCTIARAKS